MYEQPSIIKIVGTELQAPLDKLGNKETIASLQKLQIELAQQTREWLVLLYTKRNQARYPKDKDYTDFDRKIMLDADIAVIEADYNFLLKLDEILSQRIDLAFALIKK